MANVMWERLHTSAGDDATTAPSFASSSHCCENQCRCHQLRLAQDGAGCGIGRPGLALERGHRSRSRLGRNQRRPILEPHCCTVFHSHLGQRPVPNHDLGELAALQQVTRHRLPHDAQAQEADSDLRHGDDFKQRMKYVVNAIPQLLPALAVGSHVIITVQGWASHHCLTSRQSPGKPMRKAHPAPMAGGTLCGPCGWREELSLSRQLGRRGSRPPRQR